MKKLAILSGIKIPEYIRSDYPKLVQFVEAYYRFQELSTTIKDAEDIDVATEQFVKQYKESLARGFADPEYTSIRNFIYANKDFFGRKGTNEAFEYFFKAYFGQTIKVETPDYLVASGAVANGPYFFYVKKDYGTINQYDDILLTTNKIISRSGKLTTLTSSNTVISDRSSFTIEDIGLKIVINGKLIGVINEFVDTKTVKLTSNSNFATSNVSFHLTGSSSVTSLNVLKYELLDADTYVIYFIPPSGFTSTIGDKITVGTTSPTFSGTIKATPYKIVPVIPGQYWSVGQIFTIPGDDENHPTIVRVTAVTANGGIKSTEILQFGYPLSGEQFSISSFDPKASFATDSTEYSQEVFDDGHFDENFTVYDNTGEVEDQIVISLVDTNDAEAWAGDAYPDEYAMEDYFGTLKVYEPFKESINLFKQQYTEEIYRASIAVVKVLNNSYSKEYTVYENQNSLISNYSTKIHDNLKYQAFAYSIESNIDLKRYRGSIDLLHPAGMNFSATYAIESSIINNEVSILGTHTFPTIETNTVTGQLGNVSPNFVFQMTGTQSTTQVNGPT